MELRNTKVILRPMRGEDIADRIFWETEDTEWQLWDGPWDYEGKSPEERAAALEQARALWEARVAAPAGPGPARRLEICLNAPGAPHIGWLSAYPIDDQCCISETGERCAVGLTIPGGAARGKGYGFAALCLYIRYLLDCGVAEVYTQTWSGNVRMIALAEKLGFRLFLRKPGLRTVRGARYDGLTFRLDVERFSSLNETGRNP